jgi:sugar (pentulose or hexulose) kinase
MSRPRPFSVVSTGTWVISMAVGGHPVTLDPARDTLVNVDATGQPTPSARFMGGREFDVMRPGTAPPDAADLAAVLARQAFLLPAVEPASGPFPGRAWRWTDPDLSPGERSAALSFYLALMTATCLDLIGAAGPVIVEGPFAANTPFLDMLAAATGRPVATAADGGRASMGAALLATDTSPAAIAPVATRRTTLDPAAARPYADAWRAATRAT